MIVTLLYLAGFVLVVFLLDLAWERIGRGRPEPIPEAEAKDAPTIPYSYNHKVEITTEIETKPRPTHRSLMKRAKNDAFEAAAWKAIMEIEGRAKGEDRE